MSSDLIRAAQKAAKGMTSEEAFERLIQGIGRGRAMTQEIHEMFCSMPQTIELACTVYALEIGKSVESLTTEQKKQAMLNWVLDKEEEP